MMVADGGDVLYEALDERDWRRCRSLLRSVDRGVVVDGGGGGGGDGGRPARRPSVRSVRASSTAGRADAVGRTRLACLRDAPADVVESLLVAVVVSRRDDDDEERTDRDDAGRTPLHAACLSASEEVVSLLLRVAPRWWAGATDAYGTTPSHCAVRYGRSPTVVGSLLRACPAAARTEAWRGGTPLEWTLDEWREDLERIYYRPRRAHHDDDDDDRPENHLPRGPRVDGGLEGRHVLQHTLIRLLSTMRDLRLKEIGRSPSAADDGGVGDGLAVHEAFETTVVIIPPIFLMFLVRNAPKDCTRHDEDGNFPVHLACSALPFYESRADDGFDSDVCDFDSASYGGSIEVLNGFDGESLNSCNGEHYGNSAESI